MTQNNQAIDLILSSLGYKTRVKIETNDEIYNEGIYSVLSFLFDKIKRSEEKAQELESKLGLQTKAINRAAADLERKTGEASKLSRELLSVESQAKKKEAEMNELRTTLKQKTQEHDRLVKELANIRSFHSNEVARRDFEISSLKESKGKLLDGPKKGLHPPVKYVNALLSPAAASKRKRAVDIEHGLEGPAVDSYTPERLVRPEALNEIIAGLLVEPEQLLVETTRLKAFIMAVYEALCKKLVDNTNDQCFKRSMDAKMDTLRRSMTVEGCAQFEAVANEVLAAILSHAESAIMASRNLDDANSPFMASLRNKLSVQETRLRDLHQTLASLSPLDKRAT